MVWRRMRVVRKTGGKGGVSYTVTIPEEIYKAMGMPSEVLVDFVGGEMRVRPAPAIREAQGRLGDERAERLLKVLEGPPLRIETLDSIRRALERDRPTLIAVRCGSIAYYTRDDEIRQHAYPEGLCDTAARVIAETLGADPEKLAKHLINGRTLLEITGPEIIIYKI